MKQLQVQYNMSRRCLSTLTNDGQEGLLNDAKTLDSLFSDASMKLKLVTEDLTDIRVALLSFAVIAEIDYYALGKEGKVES